VKTMNESVSVMTALNIACAPVRPSASPFQANRVSSVCASAQATCWNKSAKSGIIQREDRR